MTTETKENVVTEDHAEHHEMGFWGKYVFSRDHKAIGMQFMMTALFMLFIGGGLALTVSMRLGDPSSVFRSSVNREGRCRAPESEER